MLTHMADIHQRDLLSGMHDAFGSSKYSDLCVHCEDDTYNLHRLIVCQRSRFFAACCDGDFKEAITATITLHDDDPAAVRRMFCYLYTLDYDDGEDEIPAQQQGSSKDNEPRTDTVSSSASTQDAAALDFDRPSASESSGEITALQDKVMNNVYVYAIAEKYEIPALKELARAKFQSLSRLTEGFCCSPTVIDVVFGTTPETDTGLRSIVAELCATRLDTKLAKADLCKPINEHGDLGLGMLREVAKHLSEARVEQSLLASQKESSRKRWIDLEERLGWLVKVANELSPPMKGDQGFHLTMFENRFESFRVAIRELHLRVQKTT